MDELPSMDDVLHRGARRESRSLMVLGSMLIVGGLAWKFGMHAAGWDRPVITFGAIGLGVTMLFRGLFAGPR